MTSRTPPAPAAWRFATVEHVAVETFRVKTFTFRLPEWRPFKAGQHYDVRLTAPDGYQAQRSYSIASPPEQEGAIDLTIELMEGGEVSPYFHEIVEPGDQIEMRGPIGGPFTWRAEQGGPLLLVGGGSGIVPLMSMARHRAISAPETPGALLFSSRSFEHIIYREELERLNDAAFKVVHTLTRGAPEGWTGYARRIDTAMVRETLDALGGGTPKTFVCGSSPFVEAAAAALIGAGVPFDAIRTERFGPSGS